MMLVSTIRNIGFAVSMMAMVSSPVIAQDWPDFLETKQLFRVIVSGKNPQGNKRPTIKGTAWAVTPDILITADHVTGKAIIWGNKSSAQNLFVPNREVSVIFSFTKTDDGSALGDKEHGIVTPSPFETIDAARIGFTTLGANPLPLNACGVDKTTQYRVLKFNGGKVHQPIEVPVLLKSYGSSLLGDSSSIVVMSAGRGVIKEGDSGSPVFGPDNRVIGLVSAINPDKTDSGKDEVHITLVRSFLDLIPLQVGNEELLDIPCSERARLALIDKLSSDITVANATLAAMDAENDALAQRVTQMEERNDLLLDQVSTLLWNQVRLADNIERATGRDGEALGDVSAMALVDKNVHFWERNKKVFETIKKQQPLRPTVTRISSELGSPDWTLSGSIDSREAVLINFTYSRALSGPAYAQSMKFCFSPVVWDLPGSTASEDDPSNRKFYERLEGPFAEGREEIKYCDQPGHTAPDSEGAATGTFTKGSYKWDGPTGWIGRMEKDVKRQYPESDWDGLYYLQIFEPLPATATEPASYRLHTRAFVDLIRDADAPPEGSTLPCKLFPDPKSLLDTIYNNAIELTEEDTCE